MSLPTQSGNFWIHPRMSTDIAIVCGLIQRVSYVQLFRNHIRFHASSDHQAVPWRQMTERAGRHILSALEPELIRTFPGLLLAG